MTSLSDPASIETYLTRIGLRRREMLAEWGRVLPALREAIPFEVATAIANGGLLPKGFGLGGATGVGKTMALAALVRKSVEVRAKKHEDEGSPQFFPGIKWVCWPETVARFRANPTSPEIEREVMECEESRLLVIDDLGRERMKGSYADDWATNQLDRIINARNRDMLPIMWTTNVSKDDLSTLYGAAMLSRLLEDSPLFWVDCVTNRRLG